MEWVGISQRYKFGYKSNYMRGTNGMHLLVLFYHVSTNFWTRSGFTIHNKNWCKDYITVFNLLHHDGPQETYSKPI